MFRISLKLSAAVTVLLFFFGASQLLSQDLKTAIKLTQSEQFEKADKAFRELISKDSKNGDNYFYFGQNFIKSYFTDTAAVSFKEMLDSASVYYSKGVKADAACPLNYVGLGSIALYKKDQAGAKEQFKKAQDILPSKKYKDSPVSKEKAALTLAKIAEADLYSDFRDIKLDTALINQALNFDKTNPQIYIIAGDIYLEDNDGSKAIANYKKAQELDAKFTLAKTKIGNMYVRVKNLKEAFPYFEEAVALDPNFAPVYRELGELNYKAGKYEKAKANYQKFLELSDNFAAKAKYATLLFLIKNYDEANKYIQEIFKVDTTSVIMNRIAAYSSYENNSKSSEAAKFNDALKYSERFFRRVKPEKILSGDYMYNGKIRAKLGQDTAAITRFKLALKVDSTNADALSEMAAIYTKMKNNIEAAALLEKKVSLNKASTMDFYNLAKTYYSMTDSIKTKEDTIKVLRADTLFGTFVSRQQESMNGYLWKARIKVKQDLDSKKGLAKPWYEKVFDKAKSDSVKYQREFVEALDYLAAYQLFTMQDKVGAKVIYERILAIDPKNQKAKIVLESKEMKGVKTK